MDEMLYLPTHSELERNELINKLLKRTHYPQVVKIMLEEKVWTKNGRLNKSSLIRKTGLQLADIEKAFEDMRGILRKEY